MSDMLLTQLRKLGDDLSVERFTVRETALAAADEITELRRKCDEDLVACASETCAMAQKLAAVTEERDKYRAALELALPQLGYGYDAARCPAAYNGITQAIDAVKTALAKYAPVEDPIEEARRKV